eukprot:gene17707-biopygen20396
MNRHSHVGQPRGRNGGRVIPRMSLESQATVSSHPHPPQAWNCTVHARWGESTAVRRRGVAECCCEWQEQRGAALTHGPLLAVTPPRWALAAARRRRRWVGAHSQLRVFCVRLR